MSSTPEIDPATLRQRIVDEEHLRILAICHYVVGGLEIFFSSFFIIHLVLIQFVLRHPEMWHDRPPPREFLLAASVMICVVILLGWTVGGLTIFSGTRMRKHIARNFSIVMAAFSCLWVPFGTLLGVFTLIVLNRNSVREIYAQSPAQESVYATHAM